MTTRDDLEAALRARPDAGTLAVYADLLQSQGDPRGELIALDVGGVRDYKRRGQLLTAWLGDEIDLAWSAARELWYVGDLEGTHATFDCGFVDLHVVEPDYPPLFVACLLDRDAGLYVRRLSTAGAPALLAHLAIRSRPWLQHLAIERPRSIDEPLPGELCDMLVAATPNLEVLDACGCNLFERFVHPNLRELGVTGSEAIDLVDGPPLPSVHAIDFAFDGEQPVPRGLFAPARLPALRRVSFERAEPGGLRLFEELGTLGVRSQITHLVLPSVRTYDDVALVQAAVDRMPRLREITIARDYVQFMGVGRELRHPYARVRWPEAVPWPPRERLTGRPLHIDGYTIELVELVDALERAELTEEHAAIWSRFWNAVRVACCEHTFAAADLAKALAALELTDDLQYLCELLARHPPSYLVTLRH